MKKILFSIFSGLLIASAASAGTLANVTFNTLPTVNQNGTYNGAVGSSITFPSYGTSTVSASLYCDDFNDTTYVPSGPYSYTMSNLGSTTQGKFGEDNAVIYEYAALLLVGDGSGLTGLANITPGTTANNDLITLYQDALWDLTDTEGNAPSYTYNGQTSASLVTTAENDITSKGASFYSSKYSSVVIFTPNAGNTDQEFLGVTSQSGTNNYPNLLTPEPSSWVMLMGGIGLLGLGFFGRRRAASKS